MIATARPIKAEALKIPKATIGQMFLKVQKASETKIQLDAQE